MDFLKVSELSKIKISETVKISINNDGTLCPHIRKKGAYILITNDGKYIGSTKNIHRRLRHHINFTVKGRFIKEIYAYITENIEDACKLEKWLIFELNPELNVIGLSDRKEMSNTEIVLTKENVDNGCIRRKGLYDIILSKKRR